MGDRLPTLTGSILDGAARIDAADTPVGAPPVGKLRSRSLSTGAAVAAIMEAQIDSLGASAVVATASRDSNSSGGGSRSLDHHDESEMHAHPASIIGTPADSVDARMSGVPESSSVVGSRLSTRVDMAAGELDEQTLNERAMSVLGRVKSKLAGSDFNQAARLDVATQVNRLIEEAQSNLNLCQLYVGWCPFCVCTK